MSRNYVATISVELPSRELAEAILRALKPELRASSSRGSRVQMRVEGNSMTLRLEARSVATMRALVNSYLRWTIAIRDTLNALNRAS